MLVPVRPIGLALLATVAMLAAACAPGAASPTTPPATSGAPGATSSGGSTAPGVVGSSPSSGPTARGAAPGLLLEVTSEGGFINPVAGLGNVPALVVDDDGRIYTPGVASDPAVQPIVAPVDVRDTGASGEAAILAAIRQAGLDHQEAPGGVAVDTGTTAFTVVIDGDTIVNRFAANAGPGAPGLPGGPGGPGAAGSPGASEEAGPAAAAFALLAQLTDPAASWGGTTAPPVAYQPVGYRVFVAPDPGTGAATGGATVAWPLASTLDGFGVPAATDFGVEGLRSGIVTGADATALGAALANVASGTELTAGGRTWLAWIRPLFPDELGS